MSDVEKIKAASRFLRGTIAEGLSNRISGALAESDTQLTKFHGIYQQDDRDLRIERRRQMLEPAYRFMIRARVPAGVMTGEQWLAMDRIAQEYANGTIRLTTRQAIQFHGVFKEQLKASIAAINATLLDTLAACGDVNRNVMAGPLPERSAVHGAVDRWAQALSVHLTPQTGAYHEIWLNGERAVSTLTDSEPIYGATYLPRKFKIGFAVPPDNDVDVFTQDLGFIAIIAEGRLLGFNITAGGGMGVTHGNPATYPRLGDLLGFIAPEQVLAVGEAVVGLQRDHGDRSDRKHARLKYTIDDHGRDWFRTELERRLGFELPAAHPFTFTHSGDRYGWIKDEKGRWHYTVWVENGRIADHGKRRLLSGLRTLAADHPGEFRLTPNQNIMIANVSSRRRKPTQALLDEYGIGHEHLRTATRLHALACVGMPTCGLAMAESERYLPQLLDRLDDILTALGLQDDPITIRMTGCPNGCARPYAAEIGLVGKGPGRYNLHLGADFSGQRLNRLVSENLDEKELLETLQPLLTGYASERESGEGFGDYLLRSGQLPNEVTA